jgi:hypothetical protein
VQTQVLQQAMDSSVHLETPAWNALLICAGEHAQLTQTGSCSSCLFTGHGMSATQRLSDVLAARTPCLSLPLPCAVLSCRPLPPAAALL